MVCGAAGAVYMLYHMLLDISCCGRPLCNTLGAQALGAAKGMDFVHRHDPPIIHRYLWLLLQHYSWNRLHTCLSISNQNRACLQGPKEPQSVGGCDVPMQGECSAVSKGGSCIRASDDVSLMQVGDFGLSKSLDNSSVLSRGAATLPLWLVNCCCSSMP